MGEQAELVLGVLFSRGGRSITALRATAEGGTISRTVPQFEPGTIVSVPSAFANAIVTEYEIARLLGKHRRERALELISIAALEFRGELKKTG